MKIVVPSFRLPCPAVREFEKMRAWSGPASLARPSVRSQPAVGKVTLRKMDWR